MTYAQGSSVWSSSDGAQATYALDSQSRVTSVKWLTSIPDNGNALTTTQTWDSNNNVIATTDENLAETDYAFDAQGNEIAVALPQGNAGPFRPTTLRSYDPNNNLIAICPPTWSHTNGKDWNTATPSPGSTPCPSILGSQSSPGTKIFIWTQTASEAEGEL